MIAPTSHDRIKMIAAEEKGFVYGDKVNQKQQLLQRFKDKKKSTIAKENGEWSVWISKLKASEDEVMHISTETEHLQYKDVAVGEVWVAGGQSNMEFWMRYEKHKEAAMKELPKNRLRFYDVPEISYDGQIEEFDYSKAGYLEKGDK